MIDGAMSLHDRIEIVEKEMLELQTMQEEFEKGEIRSFYLCVAVAFLVGVFIGILIGVA